MAHGLLIITQCRHSTQSSALPIAVSPSTARPSSVAPFWRAANLQASTSQQRCLNPERRGCIFWVVVARSECDSDICTRYPVAATDGAAAGRWRTGCGLTVQAERVAVHPVSWHAATSLAGRSEKKTKEREPGRASRGTERSRPAIIWECFAKHRNLLAVLIHPTSRLSSPVLQLHDTRQVAKFMFAPGALAIFPLGDGSGGGGPAARPPMPAEPSCCPHPSLIIEIVAEEASMLRVPRQAWGSPPEHTPPPGTGRARVAAHPSKDRPSRGQQAAR